MGNYRDVDVASAAVSKCKVSVRTHRDLLRESIESADANRQEVRRGSSSNKTSRELPRWFTPNALLPNHSHLRGETGFMSMVAQLCGWSRARVFPLFGLRTRFYTLCIYTRSPKGNWRLGSRGRRERTRPRISRLYR